MTSMQNPSCGDCLRGDPLSAGYEKPDRLATPPICSSSWAPSTALPTSPNLPLDVAITEIEAHLDRVALAILESPHGQEYLPLFSWLEEQLKRKRNYAVTMGTIQDRVKRLQDRTRAPS